MDRRQLLDDGEEALRIALDGRQSMIWTALPGIVQKVDLTAMTCEVQPAIQGYIEDETGTSTLVNLPMLVDVPIVFPSAGGFILTLPLAPGDEVLVVFSSRCIDAWWQSGGVAKPIEIRMHDLSDGFAIPGPRSQPKVVGGISQSGAQLRNDAGSTYLEISSSGQIKIMGNLMVTGDVSVTGAINVTGALTATGDFTAGGISLEHHVHSGVQAGGSVTGPPQ